MNIKIYNCFHDKLSIPPDRCLSDIRLSLLCGADIEHGGTYDVFCNFRDNTGDNISNQNEQYSELTGYYWVWKNDKDSDIVGIEHYHRHFIKHHHIEIDDIIKSDDLLDAKDISNLLSEADFILPSKIYLCDYTLYELYLSCFDEYFIKDCVKYMKRYFIENNMKYYIDPLYYSLSHNILIKNNMLITTKKNFNEYCELMFSIIDYLKQNVKTLAIGRTWGYITEILPLIYVMANNKSYKEADIAVEDPDFISGKQHTLTTLDVTIESFNRDPNEIVKILQEL